MSVASADAFAVDSGMLFRRHDALPTRRPSRRQALTIVAAAMIGLTGIPAARAQDASAWDAGHDAAARLIAGALTKMAKPAFIRAGIEIRLDPGWRTYWRDPGDSGVPPTFDFSGSSNVKSVNVEWPAPHGFPDGAGGNSIGYVDHVILPLHVVPDDATKPTALHLKFGYDICGNLCVPAEAQLELALPGNGAEDATLQQAEQRVPRRVALGQNAGDNGRPFAITAVHREPGGAHDRVVVDVAAPAGAPVALFVEGPTPDWSLPLPEPQDGAETAAKTATETAANTATRRFSFALDGLPPGATPKGSTLTFTAVSGDDAIEVPARLD